MEIKTPRSSPARCLKSSPKLSIAQQKLRNQFRKWKAGGKPLSKLDPLRAAYLKAKSNYQNVRRQEDNLHMTLQNNDLMACHKFNRNLIYSKLKKLQSQSSTDTPLKLETPVGTYSEDDVLHVKKFVVGGGWVVGGRC